MASHLKMADEEMKWINDIEDAAKKVIIPNEEEAWKKPSIYRVTSFARSHNPNAFTPQVISFGPFHHGAENLKATEVHKRRALEHFLHRAGAGMQLGPFLSKLGTILEKLQNSYQGLDEKWKEKPFEFLKMMLLDGCFLIEVLRLNDNYKDYAVNDPVFSLRMMHLRKPYIKRDMLLLENQLPLLVIKALLDVETNRETDSRDINNLVLKFLGTNLKVELRELASHPLELYRESMLYSPQPKHNVINELREVKVIESAVELRESGVRLRSNEQNTNLMDISFDAQTGRLELPVIHVHDGTEHLLLNMVAYEQIHVGIGTEITSYIMFMGGLIDNEADVKLLQKKKVISNFLGSHKAVADLFNSLGKEAVHPNDKLNEVRYQLSQYYENRAHKWLAYLRQKYLHNPWAVIGVIAESFVLLFTFIQTLYAVLSFHIHPGN